VSAAPQEQEGLPAKLLLIVFCPFAAGYFLSFFFRNVNAVISRDLAIEFTLAPQDLGLLTATYLLAFAAFQLPLGVLLDRYGPRRVVAALMSIAASGALVFGLAEDFATLSLGRALIGLGVSGGLMGAIKAFTLWFPPSRLATLNGLYIAVGGVGGLSATAPVEAMLEPFGWRVVFYGLAACSLAAAVAIFTVVPEKPLPGKPETFARQLAVFRTIFSSIVFWRIVAAMVVTHAAYQALQGLWLAPWLYDVAKLDRPGVAQYLLLAAFAYTLGSIFFGAASDRLARHGISRMTVYKMGLLVTLAGFIAIAADVRVGRLPIVMTYAFASISAAIAYTLLALRFPPEMSGRVSTAANVLMFSASFAFQWGIGAVLRLYPATGGGGYAPEGYSAAFALLALMQIAVVAWLLPMRDVQPPASTATRAR
jgi:predicted MFS family arabinose efflux permease